MSLGPPIRPKPPDPGPEWKPYKKNLQINSKGQIRTANPKYEMANPPYGWPFNPGSMPVMPDPAGEEGGIV